MSDHILAVPETCAAFAFIGALVVGLA